MARLTGDTMTEAHAQEELWRGLKEEAPVFANQEEPVFQNTWIDRNFLVRMWNVHSLDAPHTNNHAEGWHSK